MIGSVVIISQVWPINSEFGDVTSRLAYALQMNAFAIVPLLAGVIVVGNERFRSAAIDPTLHKESPSTEINGRVVDNTLQQSMLFLVGTLALSVNLTGQQMGVIPAATVVFVIARIAFWVGYRIHPLYRAFGMAATGYLNVGVLLFAFWKFLS